MPRVTALRRAGSAVAVELDGAPWRKLPHEVVLGCRLESGLELDRPRLRRIRIELRRVEAAETAARLLRHRDLSVVKLDAELASRGVAPVSRRETLEALGRTRVIDDRRLALARVETLAAKGYADAAIHWRLARADLPDELVAEALGHVPPELERARAVVEREGVSPRTARLLGRRGFDSEMIEIACPFVAPEV